MDNYNFINNKNNKSKTRDKIYSKFTISKLRVRKEPNGEVLKILDENEKVNIIEEKDGWARLVDNTYVMSEFLK